LQQQNTEEGLNRGDIAVNARARENVSKPTLLLGGNRKFGDHGLTRFLFQYTKPETDTTGLARDSFGNTSKQLNSFELRHDQRFGNKHTFSFGAANGKYSYNNSFVFAGIAGQFPDSQILSTSDYTFTDFYVRDEIRFNERLKIVGELRKTDVDGSQSFRILPFLPEASKSVVSPESKIRPSFIASYRSRSGTTLRFRAQSSLEGLGKTQLLHPNDEFSSDNRDSLLRRVGSAQNRIEFEADHTFKNSSFLSLGLFQETASLAFTPSLDDSGEEISRGKMRGVRARYEGNLRRDVSFFSDFIMRQATEKNSQNIAFIPRFTTQIGLQYFHPRGWFVQPSMYYQSATQTSGEERARRGGFGLFNLRVGRRLGLSTSAFLEMSNVGGKKYNLYEISQPGRRLRFGLTQRF
jgi:hypothetical protein